MTCLLIFQRQLYYPAPSYTTTTKINGLSTLNIGQLCQWNNQCPANAYCLLTCQCSDTYYFDSVSGACLNGRTQGVACQFDYQCNKISRLKCINNICNCEAVELFWNGAYSGGGGIIAGRCQLRNGILLLID